MRLVVIGINGRPWLNFSKVMVFLFCCLMRLVYWKPIHDYAEQVDGFVVPCVTTNCTFRYKLP